MTQKESLINAIYKIVNELNNIKEDYALRLEKDGSSGLYTFVNYEGIVAEVEFDNPEKLAKYLLKE